MSSLGAAVVPLHTKSHVDRAVLRSECLPLLPGAHGGQLRIQIAAFQVGLPLLSRGRKAWKAMSL
jgi:hypothetical protein